MDTSDPTVIEGYSISVQNSWYDIPLRPGDGAGWVSHLLESFEISETPAATLGTELRTLQERLASDFPEGARALVWVPAPQTGYTDATLVITNWPVGIDGADDPASFAASMNQPDAIGEGDTLLERTVWTGELEAGPFGAAHQVYSTPSEDPDSADESVIEQTVFAVFPLGCTEFLQLTFVAESIASFDAMPEQTQAIASTLRVELGVDA